MFTERARSGSTAELHEMFGHLGRLFRRLEQSPKPFVAAFNGLAPGRRPGSGRPATAAWWGRPASSWGLPEIKLASARCGGTSGCRASSAREGLRCC